MGEQGVSIEKFDHVDFVEYVAQHTPGSSLGGFNCLGQDYPYLELKKRSFKYAFAMPYGLYANVTDESALAFFLKQTSKKQFDQIVLNTGTTFSSSPSDLMLLAEKNNFDLVIGKCHVFDNHASENEVLDRLNSTRKKHIRRYQRAGQVKVCMTKDPKHFEQYYSLYEQSAKRWGSNTVYSSEFISGLWQVKGVYMWIAKYEDEVISAMICFYHDHEVFDWLAASLIDEKYKQTYAAAAVQYEVLVHAKKNGYRFVNMGASDKLEGVRNFKDSWDADLTETYTFIKRAMRFSIMKKVYNLIPKFR